LQRSRPASKSMGNGSSRSIQICDPSRA
jgi:hypothetical protein